MRKTPDDQIYRENRIDEFVTMQAKVRGMSRKQFMAFAATAAGATALGFDAPPAHACPECGKGGKKVAIESAARPGSGQNPVPHWNQYHNWFVKPTPKEYFIDHGHAFEMRWEIMRSRGFTVPNDLFYLQNHFPVQPIDVSTYRLKVTGDAVVNPMEFSYEDIKKMPSVTISRALECGENGRVFYAVQYRKQMDGAQWKLGAIGVAEWTGVPLRYILEKVGVKKGARDVMPVGIDGGSMWGGMSARPMPLEKAMADDTLLVYGMNGKPLPPDHGAPIRALVSGWIGPASIKWVGEIRVSSKILISMFNSEYGVLIGPTYKPEPPFAGKVATWQSVKSAFELPWDAVLPSGKCIISGRSWSGRSNIRRVDVSLDGGKSWKQARLGEPNLPITWTRWEVDWDATPGFYEFQARATDNTGYTQPDGSPYNQNGYVYDGVVSHPVSVF